MCEPKERLPTLAKHKYRGTRTTPLHRPGSPSSALPWPRQSSPTLWHSLSITQFILYPDYLTIFPIAIRYPSSDYSGTLFPIKCYPLQQNTSTGIQALHVTSLHDLAPQSSSFISLPSLTPLPCCTLKLLDLAPHSNSSRQASLCHLSPTATFLLSYQAQR